MQSNGFLEIFVGYGFSGEGFQAFTVRLEFFLEKFMGRLFHDAGGVDEVKVGEIQGITPNTVTSHHAVAAVGDYNAGKIIIAVFYTEIKTAPNIGADNRFQEVVSSGNGFAEIATNPERDAAGVRNKFQRDKGTDVANDLFPFSVEFFGAISVIFV